MKFERLPTPSEVAEWPQLAVLLALEASVDATLRALAAAHREVYENVFPRRIDALDHQAHRLMVLCVDIEGAIAEYRELIREEGARYRRNTF